MIVTAAAAMSVLMSVSMSMTVMMRMATAAVVFMLVPVMIFMAAAAAVFMLVLMMMFMAATAIMLVPVMMLMLMLVPVMMLMLMLVCHSNPFPSVCQFPWAPLPDKRMPCILSLQNKRRSPVMRCCYAGLNFLRRSALLTTETELSAIAAPPSMGFMSGPPKR